MRHLSLSGLVLVILALVSLGSPGRAAAQELAIPQVSQEKMAKYATAYTEIGNIRDQFHAQFARAANKTGEHQAELRKKLKEEVHKVVEAQGLTPEEYEQITWVISVDPKQAEAFHQLIGKQKGGAPK